MTWHKVTMDDRQIGSLQQIRMMREFSDLVLRVADASGGDPGKDMVVFTSHYPEPAGDHDLYHHFFSPGCLPEAEPLIKMYGGEPCEKPSNENLAFLGGFHYGEPWALVGGYRAPSKPWKRKKPAAD